MFESIITEWGPTYPCTVPNCKCGGGKPVVIKTENGRPVPYHIR